MQPENTNFLVNKIWSVLHFFHKPFSKLLSQQQFRYLACGSFIALLDIAMFVCLNDFILHQSPVLIAGYKIESYYFAAWALWPIGFLFGFMSSKYVVFPGSHLPHGTQLFRYLMLVILCFFLTNVLLNFFIGQCHFYPLISKTSTTIIVALVSYLLQRFFTFKKKKEIFPN